MQARELTEPVRLCRDDGSLNPDAVGWSRHPLQRGNLSGKWPRKKRWNYWCLTTPDLLFSVTLADIDHLGLAFAYVYDRREGTFFELTRVRPFGRACRLPEQVRASIEFVGRQLSFSIEATAEGYRMVVDSPCFDGKPLHAEVQIAHSCHDENPELFSTTVVDFVERYRP